MWLKNTFLLFLILEAQIYRVTESWMLWWRLTSRTSCVSFAVKTKLKPASSCKYLIMLIMECSETLNPSAVSFVRNSFAEITPSMSSISHAFRKARPSFIVWQRWCHSVSWMKQYIYKYFGRLETLTALCTIVWLTSISGQPGRIPLPAYHRLRQSKRLLRYSENLDVSSLSSSSSVRRSLYTSSPKEADLLNIC